MVKLRLENLGAGYGQREIISGVSTATFTGGQVVAVVGPNAAGKSTLFKRMAGLIDGPGEVVLEGSKKGTQGISYMPQGLNASARLTVYESVLLARKQLTPNWSVHDDELQLVDEILEALGITELSFRNLGELSGGQQQLVSIAQTLVREPEILLMDEPTSALDPASTARIEDLMSDLKQVTTIVIVTHNMHQAARVSDTTSFFLNGDLVEHGKTDQIFTSPRDERTEAYVTGRFG